MIAFITPIFAALQAPELPPELTGGKATGTNNLPGMHISDMLLVLIALMLVLTVLVCWALFIRKPKTDRTRTRILSSSAKEVETEDGQIRKRKRAKKKRREHRTRNPTLSETGGLPPPRSELPPSSQL